MGQGRISKLDFLTHHDAGHAAVAVHFGLRLNQFRIDQDDNSGGVTLTEEAWRKGTDIQRVLIALAGSIAERHLDPSGVGQWKGNDGDEAWALRAVVARLHSRLERRSQDYIDRILERMKTVLQIVVHSSSKRDGQRYSGSRPN
jgi:hypothetical protein